MQDLADLAVEGGVLIDEIAAMAPQHLQGEIVIGPHGIDQTESLGGSAKDPCEIGIIGLIVRVGGLTIVLGGEGMDQAGIEACLAKSSLDGTVIVAGAFDGHDDVAQVVIGHDLPEAIDGGLQVAFRVGQGLGIDEDLAIEVSDQEARTRLGTVDGDDAKVGRTDFLNTPG